MNMHNSYVIRLQKIADRIFAPQRMSHEEASSLVNKLEQAADCVIEQERKKFQKSAAKYTL